ncbi:Alkane-1 monooxygenase [Roseibacterium elongatum DSM 19469]|uniref:Alkane-1 monooxygenase n=1 Tax=Roseicyclus elongatus DSM 19469 TaxID=1294273 RepID=W8SJC6_9RHOB|nr:fatty acid desaturase [Roseibacterium elongatum]AHM02605.1 Alkane-1 monooxygenase [Roseibacterium elongatum DSM 19469]
MLVIARYACATLPPALFLGLGATLWGGFAIIALIWLTLFAALLDRLLAPPRPEADDHEPWSDGLSLLLAVLHLALLPLVLVALTGDMLGIGQKLALFFGTASFFGQVSHPNAHELIHRRPRLYRALGAAVYVSVGFGHHVSAHRLVHHRFVGTADDPNTPQPGESYWAYLPRAWTGSFRAGLSQEQQRLTRRGKAPRGIENPYWIWSGGALACLGAAAWLGGVATALLLLALWGLTGAQILLSDYIQHYGLRRLTLTNGRLEPVAPHHSWNAPRGFSSYLMMNRPRPFRTSHAPRPPL